MIPLHVHHVCGAEELIVWGWWESTDIQGFMFWWAAVKFAALSCHEIPIVHLLPAHKVFLNAVLTRFLESGIFALDTINRIACVNMPSLATYDIADIWVVPFSRTDYCIDLFP